MPMYLSFLISKLYWRTETLENLELIAAGVATSLLLYYIWGGFNYDRHETSGPFDVGYREFTTKEYSNDCSVFYPVDKGTIAPTDKSVYYLQYGDTIDNMIDICLHENMNNKAQSPHMVKYNLRCFGFATVPVKNQATLAKVFKDGTKKLQPMIFSHGLASQKMTQSALCRELASYGMFVIVMNHNDESCDFTLGPVEEMLKDIQDDGTGTKVKERKPIKYSNEFDLNDK